MNQQEDRRLATEIFVNLSTQLMAASLAMIAVEGAFVTFFIDKNKVIPLFFAASLASFVFFVLSIYFGGLGINDLAKSGFQGDWDLNISKARFNRQAIFCILGLIAFLFSWLLNGNSSSSDLEKSISALNSQIQIQKTEVQDSKNKILSFERKLNILEKANLNLAEEMNAVRESLGKK